MREIKFRAWYPDAGMVRQQCSMQGDTTLLEFLQDVEDAKDNDNEKVILMQFTGLKDKNGKEIYEGDILKGNQGNFKVTFADGAFLVIYPKGQATQWLWTFLASNGEKEVIGNIYENPELLKGQGEK